MNNGRQTPAFRDVPPSSCGRKSEACLFGLDGFVILLRGNHNDRLEWVGHAQRASSIDWGDACVIADGVTAWQSGSMVNVLSVGQNLLAITEITAGSEYVSTLR